MYNSSKIIGKHFFLSWSYMPGDTLNFIFIFNVLGAEYCQAHSRNMIYIIVILPDSNSLGKVLGVSGWIKFLSPMVSTVVISWVILYESNIFQWNSPEIEGVPPKNDECKDEWERASLGRSATPWRFNVQPSNYCSIAFYIFSIITKITLVVTMSLNFLHASLTTNKLLGVIHNLWRFYTLMYLLSQTISDRE